MKDLTMNTLSRFAFSLTLAFGLAIAPSMTFALERAAGGNSNLNAISSYNMRNEAFKAALLAAIEELRANIAACGNVGKSYAPTHASADVNGCIGYTVGFEEHTIALSPTPSVTETSDGDRCNQETTTVSLEGYGLPTDARNISIYTSMGNVMNIGTFSASDSVSYNGVGEEGIVSYSNGVIAMYLNKCSHGSSTFYATQVTYDTLNVTVE